MTATKALSGAHNLLRSVHGRETAHSAIVITYSAIAQLTRTLFLLLLPGLLDLVATN